jgi:hypothetical protein
MLGHGYEHSIAVQNGDIVGGTLTHKALLACNKPQFQRIHWAGVGQLKRREERRWLLHAMAAEPCNPTVFTTALLNAISL